MSPIAIQMWLLIAPAVLLPALGAYDHRRHHPPQRLTLLATPAKRFLELARPNGAPLSVEITSAGGRRPVVLLSGAPRELAARLARAGFAILTFDPRSSADVAMVIDALKSGALGLETDDRVGVLAAEGRGDGTPVGPDVPWLVVPRIPDERSVDTIVQWLARHLV